MYKALIVGFVFAATFAALGTSEASDAAGSQTRQFAQAECRAGWKKCYDGACYPAYVQCCTAVEGFGACDTNKGLFCCRKLGRCTKIGQCR